MPANNWTNKHSVTSPFSGLLKEGTAGGELALSQGTGPESAQKVKILSHNSQNALIQQSIVQ